MDTIRPMNRCCHSLLFCSVWGTFTCKTVTNKDPIKTNTMKTDISFSYISDWNRELTFKVNLNHNRQVCAIHTIPRHHAHFNTPTPSPHPIAHAAHYYLHIDSITKLPTHHLTLICSSLLSSVDSVAKLPTHYLTLYAQLITTFCIFSRQHCQLTTSP